MVQFPQSFTRKFALACVVAGIQPLQAAYAQSFNQIRCDVQSKKYGLPEFIAQQVVSAGNPQSVLDQIEPPYVGYRRIESALKQYLDLADKGDGPKVPAGTKTIAPGDAYAGTAQLADKLRLQGDLPPGGSFDSYSGALVEGVKHFRSRNGLATDGKLDAATCVN